MASMQEKSSVSFSGCGFLGVYHIGVASCLKKYAPHVLQNHISGASAGALAAAAVICDGSLGTMMTKFLQFVTEAHKRTLGAFCPTFDMDQMLRESIEQVLPPDAHIRCSGRLVVSVTRVSDGENIRLTHFDTREELVNALLSSAFIPGFSGVLPYSVGGVRYVDGGFTDNQPMVDEHTITVSPFAGEGDICPKDNTPGVLMMSIGNTMIECSTTNLFRFTCVVFPPGPNTLSQMCQQGYDDAMDFLQRQDLITCQDCLAMETSISVGRKISRRRRTMTLGSCSYLDGNYCETCTKEKQIVVFDRLPPMFSEIVQNAKAKAKDDLMFRLLRFRIIRIIFILFLPITLPLNVAYVILISKITPTSDGIQEFFRALTTHMKNLLDAFLYVEPSHRQYHRLSSKKIKNLDVTPKSRRISRINYHETNVNKFSDYSEVDFLSDVAQQCASKTMPPRNTLRPMSWDPSQEFSSQQASIRSRSVPNEDDVMSGPDVASLVTDTPSFQKFNLGEDGSNLEAIMTYYVPDQGSDEDLVTTQSLSGLSLHDNGGGGASSSSPRQRRSGAWRQQLTESLPKPQD